MQGKQTADSGGTFHDEWKPVDRPCPKCKAEGTWFFRVWNCDCGDYKDEQHECRACGKRWWVEGPDA